MPRDLGAYYAVVMEPHYVMYSWDFYQGREVASSVAHLFLAEVGDRKVEFLCADVKAGKDP